MDAMASIMLTYSRLKFTYMSLLTVCVVICIQSSNAEVLDPDVSSLCPLC
jgi:hypothetical protein